jgi:hypothetical protein
LDPLVRLKEAHAKKIIPDDMLIPDDMYDLTVKRFPITVAGINRIEKASGIKFPVAYVEPSLVISSPDPHSYEFGILFARTIPVMFEEKFQVVIQISAPLVAYGLKGTIHAILAHEFLHFLELIRNLPKTNIALDANTVKLSMDSLSKIKIAPAFISKIEQLQEKSSKIRKKRLY